MGQGLKLRLDRESVELRLGHEPAFISELLDVLELIVGKGSFKNLIIAWSLKVKSRWQD